MHEIAIPERTLEVSDPVDLRVRRDRIDIGAVFIVALIVRVVYFALNRATNPALEFPILDSLFHHEWARSIVAGSASDEAFFRGPLYPYLLSIIYRLNGGAIAGAILVQHILGALSCVLIYLLGREVFSRTVALTAAGIAAFYWTFVYFEGELLIVTLFLFLVVLSLWLLALAARTGRVTAVVGAGLALGLAALARPSMLVFYPAIPFVLRQSPARRWLRNSAIVLGTTAVVIAPAMVRNYTTAGAVVPIATSGGVNFYIGNNAGADGRTAIVPGTDAPWMGGNAEAVAIAERGAGRRLSATGVSRYYFLEGQRWLMAHPGDALRLWTRKLAFFWEGPERSNEKFIYFFWRRAGIGRLPMPGFWLVAPLALAGMVLQWRRRRELLALYLYASLYMLGVLAFFVNARLRLPVVPVLILFAAWTVCTLFVALRARRYRAALIPTVLILGAGLLVNASYPTFHRDQPTHHAISWYTIGSAYLQKGQKDDALSAYAAARESFEAYPSPHYKYIGRDIYLKLGALHYERGDCPQVIDTLGRVGGDDAKGIAATRLVGECLERTGRPGDAIRAYQAVLEAQPGNTTAREGLARCYEATGNYLEAQRVREQLQR